MFVGWALSGELVGGFSGVDSVLGFFAFGGVASSFLGGCLAVKL